MKNYTDSDYALNKFSEGIVYKFSDRIVEVTLADYLAENPKRTEQDFRELKKQSDAMYYDQDRADYNQTRKNVTIHGMEDSRDLGGVPLDEQYIEKLDKQYAAEAIARLLESGMLTETQRRRFILHIVNGLSLRETARVENVTFHAIAQSMSATVEKLQKIFPEF